MTKYIESVRSMITSQGTAAIYTVFHCCCFDLECAFFPIKIQLCIFFSLYFYVITVLKIFLTKKSRLLATFSNGNNNFILFNMFAIGSISRHAKKKKKSQQQQQRQHKRQWNQVLASEYEN